MPSRTTLTLLHKEAKKRVFLQGTVSALHPDLNKAFFGSGDGHDPIKPCIVLMCTASQKKIHPLIT